MTLKLSTWTPTGSNEQMVRAILVLEDNLVDRERLVTRDLVREIAIACLA